MDYTGGRRRLSSLRIGNVAEARACLSGIAIPQAVHQERWKQRDGYQIEPASKRRGLDDHERREHESDPADGNQQRSCWTSQDLHLGEGFDQT